MEENSMELTFAVCYKNLAENCLTKSMTTSSELTDCKKLEETAKDIWAGAHKKETYAHVLRRVSSKEFLDSVVNSKLRIGFVLFSVGCRVFDVLNAVDEPRFMLPKDNLPVILYDDCLAHWINTETMVSFKALSTEFKDEAVRILQPFIHDIKPEDIQFDYFLPIEGVTNLEDVLCIVLADDVSVATSNLQKTSESSKDLMFFRSLAQTEKDTARKLQKQLKKKAKNARVPANADAFGNNSPGLDSLDVVDFGLAESSDKFTIVDAPEREKEPEPKNSCESLPPGPDHGSHVQSSTKHCVINISDNNNNTNTPSANDNTTEEAMSQLASVSEYLDSAEECDLDPAEECDSDQEKELGRTDSGDSKKIRKKSTDILPSSTGASDLQWDFATEFRAKFAEQDRKIEKLSQENGDLRTKVAEQEQKIEKLSQENGDLRTNVTEQALRLAKLSQENGDLRGSVEKLETDVSDLQSKLSSAKQKRASAEQSKENTLVLHSEISELKRLGMQRETLLARVASSMRLVILRGLVQEYLTTVFSSLEEQQFFLPPKKRFLTLGEYIGHLEYFQKDSIFCDKFLEVANLDLHSVLSIVRPLRVVMNQSAHEFSTIQYAAALQTAADNSELKLVEKLFKALMAVRHQDYDELIENNKQAISAMTEELVGKSGDEFTYTPEVCPVCKRPWHATATQDNAQK